MVCLNCLLVIPLGLLFVGLILSVLLYFNYKRKTQLRIKKRRSSDQKTHVALFHPYCNAGGGGERVLWIAVQAILKRYDNAKVFIYTGDIDATSEEILQKAKNTFNVSIDKKDVEFIFLNRRKWVEAEKYPHFTLLGQSLGSVFLGIEALSKHPPDIFIDTMGYAFTLPIFKYIGGCKIGSYVHYPTISTDMLRRVQSRVSAHNNIVRNPFATYIKLVYYRLFARMYSCVGRCSDTVMVNSSWTENHINSLWNIPCITHRVYPPCEVSHLKNLQSTALSDRIIILSIGQFRPEKDHPLQLHAMYELRTILNKNEDLWNKLRLVVVGSCRNDEDLERMQNMKDLSKHLSLENNVEFKVNVSYQELIQTYQSAAIGIHTMWNEHFGIGVVESMAAGLIMVANRSGGPLMDIVETSEGSQNGYLAMDAIGYANCIATILYNTKEHNNSIREAARASVERFSEKEFSNGFIRAIGPLF